MKAPELIRLIRETPFEPLEFKFSDGALEIVKHADNVIVTGSRIAIAQFDAGGDVPDWIKHYSLRHLVSVEPVQAQSA